MFLAFTDIVGMKPVCRNCGDPNRAARQRGLCWKCNADPVVRAKFPPDKRGRRTGQKYHDDPTEEELDAIIAEQLRNLPPWWGQERGNAEKLDD